jgi:hypothetical protein
LFGYSFAPYSAERETTMTINEDIRKASAEVRALYDYANKIYVASGYVERVGELVDLLDDAQASLATAVRFLDEPAAESDFLD